VFYTPDKLGQLWPFLPFLIHWIGGGFMKYAVCWKYSICIEYLIQIIYNKTIFISYSILFAIIVSRVPGKFPASLLCNATRGKRMGQMGKKIIIKNKFNSKIFSLNNLNTYIVKYYYRGYNQPVTKNDYRKSLIYHWVETSETLPCKKEKCFL
jgi:hypothetical protein